MLLVTQMTQMTQIKLQLVFFVSFAGLFLSIVARGLVVVLHRCRGGLRCQPGLHLEPHQRGLRPGQIKRRPFIVIMVNAIIRLMLSLG
jgi:hypothetical protein